MMVRQSAFAAAAAAALAISTPTAKSAPAASGIPFTTAGGMVRVNASIDGAAPRPMLVDLGAGIDVLTSAAAARAHLQADTAYVARRMRGDRVKLAIGTLHSLTLGSLRVQHPWAAAWRALDGHGIDGLISASQFRAAAVTFDYARGMLTFEDANSLAARAARAVRIPLRLHDDRGISLALFARFDFGHGQSGVCEIDTGSQGFFLDSRYAAKLGYAAHSRSGKLAALAQHGVPRTAIANAAVRFERLIYDCNIGNDFWTGRSFTLDIPDRALYV